MTQRLIQNSTEDQHPSDDQHDAGGWGDLVVEEAADTEVCGGKQDRMEGGVHCLFQRRRRCILTPRWG